MSTRVDYDAIAHLYDDRRRDHGPDERLAAFLAGRRLAPGATRVLDVGCGTGKQLAANRRQYPSMRLVGVDLSGGMLRVARAREPRVAWIHGDAQALPIASAAFDYATNQFSYPHIGDPRRFVAEVFRALRPGGRFVLTNIDPWSMTDWALYRYFPEAFARDARDFLPVDRLTSLLASAGFDPVTATTVDWPQPNGLQTLLSSVAQRHSASQLIAIADAAYDAGLQRIRDDLARGVTTVASPFVVVTIEADKPT
jgi:ubiquinone/menaquinone biosynthesis C-methylase UbiE